MLQQKANLCDELVEQVKMIVSYSQGVNPTKLDYVPTLIDDWEKAKRSLSQDFLDGELIKEFGLVTFELGEKEKTEKVQTFAANLYDNPLLTGCMDFFDIDKFSDFIMSNASGFFNNIVQHDYMAPLGLVKAGSRISKAFKFFIPDPEVCRHFQDVASEIIQQGSITGTLCLSVHPLDYLSISENNYNWRSCHALDGCHRAGNLSYMLDNCTLVCYIKGDKEVKLPRFPAKVPWNNKKWRVLLYVSPNRELWFAGRQYPFTSDYALNSLVYTKILKTLPKDECYYYSFTKWRHVFSQVAIPNKDTPYASIDHETVEQILEENCSWTTFEEDHLLLQNAILPISAVVKDRQESMHYDDVLLSDKYVPSYSYRKRGTLDRNQDPDNVEYSSKNLPGFDEGFVINMGAPTYCLCCGALVMDEGDFLCGWCEATYGSRTKDIYNCEICGRRTPYTAIRNISALNDDVDIEQPIHLNSFYSARVCDYCYENHTVTCPVCKKRYAKDNPIIYYKTPKKQDEIIGCAFDKTYNKQREAYESDWLYNPEELTFSTNINITQDEWEQLTNPPLN